MPEKKINVKLLQNTDNALAVIYAACRQCYSPLFAGEIYEDMSGAGEREKASGFIRKVVKSGHESPLEHVTFTFAVEGVSRALTHQLVRHRLASYSQQSQRYVKEDDFDFIIPPVFEEDEELKNRFLSVMSDIRKGYNDILSFLEKKGIKGERANQDARFVLPQAAETKIVVTMNCRELIHFFAHRCCARAQWEIRELAGIMLEVCKRELPEVFSGFGAKCERLGYCPEGAVFGCGRFPVKAKT